MTERELRRRFPRATDSFIKANAERLCPVQPECSEGGALEGRVSRKDQGGRRIAIRFEIHAVRPLDWDNYSVKPLGDMLIKAGILPLGDGWDALEGSIASRKVHTKEEERTEVYLRYA